MDYAVRKLGDGLLVKRHAVETFGAQCTERHEDGPTVRPCTSDLAIARHARGSSQDGQETLASGLTGDHTGRTTGIHRTDPKQSAGHAGGSGGGHGVSSKNNAPGKAEASAIAMDRRAQAETNSPEGGSLEGQPGGRSRGAR